MRPTYEYILQPTPTRRVSFGRTELLNIGMAMGALTLVFVIVWFNPLLGPVRIDTGEISLIVVSSFIAVLTGFLMHEIAHKVVAVRYGLWAEFRADRRGLLFAFVTAIFGFVIAAPGAVMIAGPVSLRQNGKISAAGPLTNLGFGGTFFALLFAFAFFHIEVLWYMRFLFIQITLVNLILGTFNMIPFPPLDGSKIWWWKKSVWAGMFAIFAVLLGTFFIYL
jgi:Zn-dependent protease